MELTTERRRRHPVLAFLEMLGWVCMFATSYGVGVVVAIVGTDRCGGDWLFGTTEPDAGCFVWWQVAACAAPIAAFAALTARLVGLGRRHRSAIRRALIGVRPDDA